MTAANAQQGGTLLRVATVGTAVFVVTATAGAVAPDSLAAPSAVVSGVLFAVGCGAFLWAYGIAIGRSRTDLIGIGGLFFLQGSAPASVRRHLLLALAVQAVAAVATASVRLYTPLAFGALAPMFGLGLAGLWAARYGTFPTRPARPTTGRPEATRPIEQNDHHGRSDDRAPDDPRLS